MGAAASAEREGSVTAGRTCFFCGVTVDNDCGYARVDATCRWPFAHPPQLVFTHVRACVLVLRQCQCE